MRKLILMTLVVMVSLSSVYAQKCKPAIKTTDEFTEQEIVAWGGKLGSARNMFQGVSQNLKLYIGELNDKLFIEIQVQYQQKGNDASVNQIDIPKGSQFMIKTTDGILNFTASSAQKAKRKMMGYNITAVSLSADITWEQVEQLSNNAITMYRIVPTETEPIKGKVKKGTSKKLMKQFTCFYKTK